MDAAYPAGPRTSGAGPPKSHPLEAIEAKALVRTLVRLFRTSRDRHGIIQASGARHLPDLLDLCPRIADDLGDWAEAMKVSLHLLHVGFARICRHVDDQANLGKRYFDFLDQLRAAAVERRLGVNGYRLEFNAVLLRAFVADHVGAGDQRCHHRFCRRRPHVRALTLLRLVDNRLDVADGNLCARMCRTAPLNALGDGGLLSYDNHDVPYSCCTSA